MTFFSTSDIQLFHTRSSQYQVPFFCQRVNVDGITDGWHIKPAVSLKPSLARTLAVELDACAAWKTVHGHVLLDEVFRSQFILCEGITPQFWFRKDGEKVESLAEEVEEARESWNPVTPAPSSKKSFVVDLHKKTGIDDLSVLKALWNAICNHMAYWLIVEQREIDFGWFKLHAFPVRGNWKQVMLAKHPGLRTAARLTGDDREEFLTVQGVKQSLQQTDLIALKGDAHEKHVDWSIEVEPTESWDQYVAAAERQRRSECGDGDLYVNWWGEVWGRLRESAIGALLRFASQSAVPAATVGKGGARSRTGFVEYLQPGTVLPVDVDRVDVLGPGDDCEVAVRKPSGQSVGYRKTPGVRGMPVLQLPLPNVRNTRTTPPNG